MTAALEVRGLEFAFTNGRVALREIDLRVAPGESVGLIGPNGAGKTTLLLTVAGLLEPRAGRIAIFGKEYGEGDDRDIRRRVGFVFQETEDQLFSSRVFDDVAFGPLNFGVAAHEVAHRVSEALRCVRLDGFEDRVPHHLSSGERRRVAIASVLSYRPDLLILDEPTSDLDPRGRRELVALLARSPQTRLIASHDLELVLRTCARLVVIAEGRIVADGDAVDIVCDTAGLREHGLEPPLGLRGLDPEALRRLLEAG